MLKDQMELIRENEITGKGILSCRTADVVECDYSLKIRTSRLKVKKNQPGNKVEKVDYMITTMTGTITLDGSHFVSIFRMRNQLTLHLNDDFLMPICAFPTKSDQFVYQVIGRVVTQPEYDLE